MRHTPPTDRPSMNSAWHRREICFPLKVNSLSGSTLPRDPHLKDCHTGSMEQSSRWTPRKSSTCTKTIKRVLPISKLLQPLHHGVCPKAWSVGEPIDVREDQVQGCFPAARGASHSIVWRLDVKPSRWQAAPPAKKTVAASPVQPNHFFLVLLNSRLLPAVRTRNSTCSLVRLFGVRHSRLSLRRSGSQCPSATTLHLALKGPSPFALSRKQLRVLSTRLARILSFKTALASSWLSALTERHSIHEERSFSTASL